ncbi:calmodulin-dependent protein kinase [Gigaspora margarita]|nr:calmodulin-dependent protein kinase [Gigaspora margarita]
MSKTTSEILGNIPYIDPQCFIIEKSQDRKSRRQKMDKKSDIYSIGVLLWEISSERPPFKDDKDSATLPLRIRNGLREEAIVGINDKYITIYEKCWQNKPSDRPSLEEVSMRLNYINAPFFQDIPLINISDFATYIDTTFDGIQKNPAQVTQDTVNELYSYFCKLFNEGKSVREIIVNFISERQKSDDDIFNWLSNHKYEPKYGCLLGLLFSWHIGTKESNVVAFDLFLNAAKRGDTIAQYFAGRCYEDGWNTTKNMKEAIEWYTKAANSRCAAAEYKLGDYYYKCDDYSKAFELFKSSAEKGNVMAIHELGLCYQKGYGTDVDTDKGFKLLKQAAEIGLPISQYDLAKCYEFKGTIDDFKKALFWYQRAIENNYNCCNERELVKDKIHKIVNKS